MKHPQNRAERRKIKSLATNRFRDHVHENEEKRFLKRKIEQQETEDALKDIDTSDGND